MRNVFSSPMWKCASLLFQFALLWLWVRFDIFGYVYCYLYFLLFEFTFHILCTLFLDGLLIFSSYWHSSALNVLDFDQGNFRDTTHTVVPRNVSPWWCTMYNSLTAVLHLLFLINYGSILSLIWLLSFNIACVIFFLVE